MWLDCAATGTRQNEQRGNYPLLPLQSRSRAREFPSLNKDAPTDDQRGTNTRCTQERVFCGQLQDYYRRYHATRASAFSDATIFRFPGADVCRRVNLPVQRSVLTSTSLQKRSRIESPTNSEAP